jgi:hypothetical protein
VWTLRFASLMQVSAEYRKLALFDVMSRRAGITRLCAGTQGSLKALVSPKVGLWVQLAQLEVVHFYSFSH